MGAGPSINPVVPVVAVFVIAAVLISFGNKRQKPILWAAFFIVAAMALFPPWLGEKVVWGQSSETPEQHNMHYRHLPVSMGYAPLWSPPQRQRTNTWEPMQINWPRLLTQIGVVVFITGVLVLAFKRKRKTLSSDDQTYPVVESGPHDEGHPSL